VPAEELVPDPTFPSDPAPRRRGLGLLSKTRQSHRRYAGLNPGGGPPKHLYRKVTRVTWWLGPIPVWTDTTVGEPA
jgi:hypothetical protein